MAEFDFTRPSDVPHVVLHTLNSGGVDLHASRAILAMYSSRFRQLFYDGAKQKDINELQLEVDFEIVHIALKFIHHVGKERLDYNSREYSTSQLSELYLFATNYDIPLIRSLSSFQLLFYDDDLEGALKVALQLKLQEVKEAILTRMDKKTVTQLFDSGFDKIGLTKEDIEYTSRSFFEKMLDMDFRDWRKTMDHYMEPSDLYDVVLRSSEPDSRPIYASKEFLATFSPYFRAMFFGGFMDVKETRLYVGVEIVQKALDIVILGDIKVDLRKTAYCKPPLKDLYIFADQYDFPLLRKWCIAEQMIVSNDKESLECAVDLDIRDLKEEIIQTTFPETIQSFLHE